jgi:hypothetical protein
MHCTLVNREWLVVESDFHMAAQGNTLCHGSAAEGKMV